MLALPVSLPRLLATLPMGLLWQATFRVRDGLGVRVLAMH
jgi:hypothetical protein